MSTLIERAKQYNQELKQIEKEASSTKAHISYGEQDLLKLCNELSSLLGTEVNEDNVEKVCKEQMDKIIGDLETGERTIKSIKEGTYSQKELERTIEIQESVEKEEFVRHSHINSQPKELEHTNNSTIKLSNIGGMGSIVGHQDKQENRGGININNMGADEHTRILDI